MDKQIAAVLIDAAVRELRGRSYPEVCALIGDPQCKEVSGPDGKVYQIEFEAHWDDPRRSGGNVRVVISIDDGTFRAAFHPMTRDFIMASDSAFVGEPENNG